MILEAGVKTLELIRLKKSTSEKSFDFFAIFFLLSLLLHQPHNLVLPVTCSMTCMLWNESCNRIRNASERTIAKVFVHFWAGKLFYFYQGNSNR